MGFGKMLKKDFKKVGEEYVLRKKRSSVASKVSKIEKRLQRFEKKKFDISMNTGNADLNGVSFDLCSIAQGNELQQRVGLKISPVGLTVRFKLQCATDQPTLVRVIIYQDLQTISDSINSSTDLLQNTGQQSVLSPYNRDEIGRFKVYYDKVITLNPNGANQKVYKSFYLKGLKAIHYNGANVGDIQKNNLVCTILSDQSLSYPTWDFYSRLVYTDN